MRVSAFVVGCGGLTEFWVVGVLLPTHDQVLSWTPPQRAKAARRGPRMGHPEVVVGWAKNGRQQVRSLRSEWQLEEQEQKPRAR